MKRMNIWKHAVASTSLVLMMSCVTAGGTTKAGTTALGADDVPTKSAASAGDGDTSRMIDCIGENQDKGATRKDCLPNDADGAARDTQAGSGSSDLRP